MVAQNLYQYRIFTNIEALKFQLCETKVSLVNKTQQAVHYYTVDQGYLYKKILHDSAWFCKILQNSETFCKIYEKFEAKILLRNYQRLKQTLPILRYGVQKLNYQRLKLPISKVTNIEVYLYIRHLYYNAQNAAQIYIYVRIYFYFKF